MFLFFCDLILVSDGKVSKYGKPNNKRFFSTAGSFGLIIVAVVVVVVSKIFKVVVIYL